MSENIGSVVSAKPATKSVKATPKKNAKPAASKPAKKPKKAAKPDNIITAKTGSYTSRTGNEFAARHKGSYKFAASGGVFSVSALMRYLGFWFGASKVEAVAWLRACGFTEVTEACAGHQSGSGRNTPADKQGNPAGPGIHGSVPVLPDKDYAELRDSFAAANGATRNAKGESK